MQIDKSRMKDSQGRYVTQALFLELVWNEDYSFYSIGVEDKHHFGRDHIPLKRYYLEMEDTTEYEFANKFFVDWDHWQKCLNNKLIKAEVEKWREELSLKLRAAGVKKMRKLSDEGSYQATKWLTDNGWELKKAGRPSKAQLAREKAQRAQTEKELASDASRILEFVKK